MRALLWRIIYAVLILVMVVWIVPLFFAVVGFSPGAAAWTLIKACSVCLAVLYVLMGPQPPAPF